MSEITRVYYNKLVRDAIPGKIASKGEVCEVRTITDSQELQQELLKKVQEEASSLAMSRTKAEFLEEYCDLMMVLNTLIVQLQVEPEEIESVLADNVARKGAYEQAHYLHWSQDVNYQSNESPQGIPL